MAAETALAAGASVDVYEQMSSPARKFLIAGKGGLNLTHSEPFDDFVGRFGARTDVVRSWLARFDADRLRRWSESLGYPTVVGSSGRVFPFDFKAGPLLRAWLRRLRAAGMRLHTGVRWTGIDGEQRCVMETDGQRQVLEADAVIFALGGASWPQLGADARWVEAFAALGIDIAPLKPANVGFERRWSAPFAERYAGAPLKNIVCSVGSHRRRGEALITRYGIEGSVIYALGAALRDSPELQLTVDLLPDKRLSAIETSLAKPRGKRSFTDHARRAGIDPIRLALVRECAPSALDTGPSLAATLKQLCISFDAPRPIDEAISTAGGVRLEQLDSHLQLRTHPRWYCVREMLDWEAPTGGYLLTACMASGAIAGEHAACTVV
jgi:hypothetical protein